MRAGPTLFSPFALLACLCTTAVGHALRQTTREEVVARGTRTWSAQRRQASPAVCGLPANTNFILEAEGRGFWNTYAVSTNPNDQLNFNSYEPAAAVFTFNSACNLVFVSKGDITSGAIAGIPSGSTGSLLVFYTTDQLSANNYAAPQCMVTNSQLSCSGGVANMFAVCADASFALYLALTNAPNDDPCTAININVITT